MTLTLDRTATGRDLSRDRSLIRRLAGEYHLTPGSASQFLYGPVGLPARMEALFSKLVAFGAVPLAERILGRFQAAVDGRPAPALDAPLALTAQQADSDEDVAEIAFSLDPSDENLERYARATERQSYTSSEKALALRAEQRRRKP